MTRNSFFGGPVLVAVLAGLTAMALSASTPALAASSGECVTAHIEASFRLPDGLLYPAGTLTLCDGGAYSPVDTFQRILVEGSSIGLFVSSRRRAESRGDGVPQVQFRRDTDGHLALVGFTLPSSGGSVAFRMKTQDEALIAKYRREVDGASAAPLAAIVATTAGTR